VFDGIYIISLHLSCLLKAKHTRVVQVYEWDSCCNTTTGGCLAYVEAK
jgi:hypothetical protein